MESAARLIGKLKMCASSEELARAAWPAAVGRRIAVHSSVAALYGSTLVVEVEDPVWQGHLTTLRDQILRNLDNILGSGLVRGIEFRPMIPRRMPKREERAARPRDEADQIADPAMRRLYRAARRKATA
jgi:predicted nucleic acid-binding Zn ribbon protein